MKSIINILLLALLISISGCKKIIPDVNKITNLSSDWIFPIAKTKFTFKNINEVRDKKTIKEITPLKLGYVANTYVNVPPLNISYVGPYAEPISEFLNRIYYDSLNVRVVLSNNFPIVIEAGTIITFRNTNEPGIPGNLVYSYTMENDLQPFEKLSITSEVSDYFLNDTVYIFLENFRSPGGDNVIFSDNPTTIEITYNVVELNHVEIISEKRLVYEDTMEMSLDESLESIDDTTQASGQIILYADNALPVNQKFQLYFLKNEVIIDSLFTSPVNIIGCNVDGVGNPLNMNTSADTAIVTYSKLKNINECNSAIVKLSMDSYGYPPPLILANKNTYLGLQLVGDLHINLNFKNVN